jgi:hypothetical protein
MLALTCGLAFGQTAKTTSSASTPHGNFYDACPSGHRVEFQIGSLSLFIDPHWLDLASEFPLGNDLGRTVHRSQSRFPSSTFTVRSSM